MCRILTVQCSLADAAARFGAALATSARVGGEVVEGDHSIVVRQDGGGLSVVEAGWGFPRRTLEGGLRGDAPQRVGLVADLTNPMWDKMVASPRHRCLIPLTHFANPSGEPGHKTRTWFALRDEPLAAWAGFCRVMPEFGLVFAGMTMTANEAVSPYNDRMPALLAPDEYQRWLQGSITDVIEFQFRASVPAARMTLTPTDDRWRSGKVPDFGAGRQMALL